MKKHFKKIIALSFAIVIFPSLTLAAPIYDNLQQVGQGGPSAPYADSNEYKLSEIVGIVIQAFLGILGVLFLVYLIYAGYAWMTAQGDEEKVTKAKDTISRAIIGLLVTIGAYAISAWVFDRLLTVTNILS